MKFFICLILVFASFRSYTETQKDVTVGKSSLKDCEEMKGKGYEKEYEACLKISSPKKIVYSEGSVKDCEAMNPKGYEEEYKACLRISNPKKSFACEEVNDQYVICNGIRYVADVKNDDSLKRDSKRIENFMNSEKVNQKSQAVQK